MHFVAVQYTGELSISCWAFQDSHCGGRKAQLLPIHIGLWVLYEQLILLI